MKPVLDDLRDTIQETSAAPAKGQLRELPLDKIFPNPHQPRTIFRKDSLSDLARSLKTTGGVLQPIVVYPDPQGEGWILIMGERRWRAAKEAGQATIRAEIREGLSETQILDFMLIENEKREDLTLLERAHAYERRKQLEPGMSDRRLGEILGHKANTVTKVLAALRAEGVVRETLEEGRITDPDALFLFSRLTELQQESLRRAAARADVTISRGMVRKRLEEIDERRRAEAEPAPHPSPQGEAPRDEPSSSPLPAAEPSSRPARSASAPPDLPALLADRRLLRALFRLLELPLSDDPEEALATLYEFLEAHAQEEPT